MTTKLRTHSGTTDPSVREYEVRHRAVARAAGADGIVLLKNENQVLPLKAGASVALYGTGATRTVPGGTGSGSVQMRDFVSIHQGLKNAGFTITTEEWLVDGEKAYVKAHEEYRQTVLNKVDTNSEDIPRKFKFFAAYTSTPFVSPAGSTPTQTDAETAIYVITRVSGEAKDRYCRPGDYLLSQEEEDTLAQISHLYTRVVVLINAGGLIDLSFVDRYPNIDGLVYMHQPGMEAGNAVADVLSGQTPASGKLTDSWAYQYSDYPASANFSHNNGNLAEEVYDEGLFVGYRYFDTFEVPVRYGFGFGLTYATFSLKTLGIKAISREGEDPEIAITVEVTNTGSEFSGREVVQVYASCPQVDLPKEYRRLVGFAKTDLLAPGETQELVVRFPLYALASYSEELPGWVLERGSYGLFVGNSLAASSLEASVQLPDAIVMTETRNVCPPEEILDEMKAPLERTLARRASWEKEVTRKFSVSINPSEVKTQKIDYDAPPTDVSAAAEAYVDTLSMEQLTALVNGEISSGSDEVIGASGVYVPGSGGQTSTCAIEKGLASIVLADGPAGLRVQQKYQVVDGKSEPITFEMRFANGIFSRAEASEEGETWYQYCTAIPTGTTLAQTWDVAVLDACGEIVAEEMEEFGVTVWLAPGMNIHRDPLNGRNFEYYSEDPVLTGTMAAAMTRGVHSRPGCFTTLKHLACNNSEDNRTKSNSIVSERTLREIYLRGFELAVREARPAALMTSYNKINGTYSANNYDLCTAVVRKEWGFDGIFITDWTTTQHGPECTASGCMRAGNDLVMPGSQLDQRNLREELEYGSLDIADLKLAVGRIVQLIWKSGWCEAPHLALREADSLSTSQ